MQFVHDIIMAFGDFKALTGLGRAVTMAFLFFSLQSLQLMWIILTYPFIAVFYLLLVPKAHDAWIATFNEGWSPSVSHAWFWTISRIIYKLSNFLNRPFLRNVKGLLRMIVAVLSMLLDGVRALQRSMSRRWHTRHRVNRESLDAELDILI